MCDRNYKHITHISFAPSTCHLCFFGNTAEAAAGNHRRQQAHTFPLLFFCPTSHKTHNSQHDYISPPSLTPKIDLRCCCRSPSSPPPSSSSHQILPPPPAEDPKREGTEGEKEGCVTPLAGGGARRWWPRCCGAPPPGW